VGGWDVGMSDQQFSFLSLRALLPVAIVAVGGLVAGVSFLVWQQQQQSYKKLLTEGKKPDLVVLYKSFKGWKEVAIETWLRMAEVPHHCVTDYQPNRLSLQINGKDSSGDFYDLLRQLQQTYPSSLVMRSEKQLLTNQTVGQQKENVQRILEALDKLPQESVGVARITDGQEESRWAALKEHQVKILDALAELERQFHVKEIRQPLPQVNNAPQQAKERVVIDLTDDAQQQQEQKQHQQSISEIAHLAKALDKKMFLLGQLPTTLDAVAYALLSFMLDNDKNSQLQQALQQHTAIVRYVDRMKKLYWSPEFQINTPLRQ